MELEKIATNAVETSIVKTDRLTSFISRGDKEPCWDGNIYIHESKNHNKRNIKKVSTQIKGKAVTPDQVGNTIVDVVFARTVFEAIIRQTCAFPMYNITEIQIGTDTLEDAEKLEQECIDDTLARVQKKERRK